MLITYGGIWIDSTLLLTAAIPKTVQDSELFLFKFNRIENIEPRNISNWFIVSKPHNKILILVRDLLYKYWFDNDVPINYFIFHYFFRMATEKFAREWERDIHITENTNLLLEKLFCKLNLKQYEYIKKISFCQKLSYKIDITKQIKGTYYEAILNDFL